MVQHVLLILQSIDTLHRMHYLEVIDRVFKIEMNMVSMQCRAAAHLTVLNLYSANCILQEDHNNTVAQLSCSMIY